MVCTRLNKPLKTGGKIKEKETKFRISYCTKHVMYFFVHYHVLYYSKRGHLKAKQNPTLFKLLHGTEMCVLN